MHDTFQSPSTMPFAVDCVDPLWIPMSDGVRLAATLWRPVTPSPVPVVVEMVPYRRRDGTVARDMEIQPYLAGHGVATVRIDIRGCGDSEGDLADEYTAARAGGCMRGRSPSSPPSPGATAVSA